MHSLLPALTLLCFLKPTFSLKNEERAIIPTTSGQIGINPVTLDLGEPTKWWVFICLEPACLADGVFLRIGVNTEYLTELVDDGKTSTKASAKVYYSRAL